MSEKYAFRVYYTAGWRSYSGQDRIYNLSCNINNEKIDYYGIIEEITDITNYYAPEDKIEEYLTNSANYYDWKGLKYFYMNMNN